MEFLGDAVIELMTIFLARQVFIFLRKAYTPEMLHMLKPALLSKEGGLTRLYMNLKLHRFLIDFEKMPEELRTATINYMKNASPDYKDLWFLQTVIVRKSCYPLTLSHQSRCQTRLRHSWEQFSLMEDGLLCTRCLGV